MDDSNKPCAYNPPFGMSTFGPTERKQFGQNLRLAIACIEAAPQPTKGCALPKDEPSIRQRLKALSQEINSNHADLLELLVRYDNLQGWKSSGASHCAAWMNFEIGISLQLSWEYLRVGRKLQTLPAVKALFRVGKLSWSKVRLITRVANNENERTLCHAALDASVSDVKRLCEGYRWNDDISNIHENNKAENELAIQQWASRALTWHETSNGCTRIQLVLPPETAQAFLNSVEQSLNQLGTVSSNENNSENNTVSKSRADAAVLMAETSLQNAGRSIATADRYQVSISVDESELATDPACNLTPSNPSQIPAKRPTLYGVGPIARETARRIACDCTVSTKNMSINKTNNSEPIDIGRKSRLWPNAMARAIKERDQHCAWPGCTHSHHLHIHHIKHWADGGKTAMHNGVCLCSYHHTHVHEGGYTIEHVETSSQRQYEQFLQQHHNDDVSQFDFEKALRNDRESFNTVRKLSPTRFRFRILDAHGQVFTGCSSDDANCAKQARSTSVESVDYTHVHYSPATLADSIESTHVYSDNRCNEALPDVYYRKKTESHTQDHATALPYKAPSRYEMTV